MDPEAIAWRSPELGEGHELQLDGGVIGYFERGEGRPVVFVHGALVNANLWRKVVSGLAPKARCISLDLPLGAHLKAMERGADLSPLGLANLIADAIEKLGLEDVTLVGNDTGGALCQLVAAHRRERVGALVLTSCDAFENFPPKAVKPMMPLLKVPGSMGAMLAPLRIAGLRRRAATMMGLTKRPIPAEVSDANALPALKNSGVRRDARQVMVGMNKRYTLEASERFGEFDKPVLVAWSQEDRFFSPKYAKRLAEAFPKARLEWIDDAYTFSPEDQPERLAELIAELAQASSAAA
ncbi:MAG TPA: alpha/beta hydrolase [Solirubrobacterales bacterium]|jgi:pimeloyl-ACP methyl ester carboxylesterase|nr:alpha/beta hydrolase [Solirubrobacterales bacterium]